MGNLYQLDLPTQLLGGISAFTPGFTRSAGSGAQQYKQGVNGQPGTQGIPAPTRDTVPSPDLGDLAQAGCARSSDAPDMWYPNQYYQQTLQGNPGPVTPVRVYSQNTLPVPAVDPRGHGALMARPAVFLGQNQIAQPRTLPYWGSGA